MSHCLPPQYKGVRPDATIYSKMPYTGILYRCACPYQASSDDRDIFHSRLGVQTLVGAMIPLV